MKCNKCKKVVETAFELTYTRNGITTRTIICDKCLKENVSLNVAMIRYIDLRKVMK